MTLRHTQGEILEFKIKNDFNKTIALEIERAFDERFVFQNVSGSGNRTNFIQ